MKKFINLGKGIYSAQSYKQTKEEAAIDLKCSAADDDVVCCSNPTTEEDIAGFERYIKAAKGEGLHKEHRDAQSRVINKIHAQLMDELVEAKSKRL